MTEFKKVNLFKFSNTAYEPGNYFIRMFWYLLNSIFLNSSLPYPLSVKVLLLKTFGAKIGSNVVIKPNVNIKYPWFLELGDNVWIGEEVWIDNLAEVKIGSNSCLSQGAYLLTGNHNYKKESFDLIVKPIIIEEGVWIGAKTIVCPGVVCKSHSILTVGSVATKDLDSYSIYQGNPAIFKKKREIN